MSKYSIRDVRACVWCTSAAGIDGEARCRSCGAPAYEYSPHEKRSETAEMTWRIAMEVLSDMYTEEAVG